QAHRQRELRGGAGLGSRGAAHADMVRLRSHRGRMDQRTERVVGAIAPKLEQAEIERVSRKPTDSLDAYDCYLRAHATIHPWTRAGNEEALNLFCSAIELDPGFAAAYGMAAWCRVQRKAGGWMQEREIGETERLARRAAQLGEDDAIALSVAGFAL